MKLALLWAFLASPLVGQDDPFSAEAPAVQPSETVYDLDEVHQWDDVIVKLGGDSDPKIVDWISAYVASHKGIDGKTLDFSFRLDAKVYEKALQHPDLNGGIVLMSGDPRFPLLHCWLRPFSTHGGMVTFSARIPIEQLKTMYIAFIPNGPGKKRYLYNLNEVSQRLQKRPETKDEKE